MKLKQLFTLFLAFCLVLSSAACGVSGVSGVSAEEQTDASPAPSAEEAAPFDAEPSAEEAAEAAAPAPAETEAPQPEEKTPAEKAAAAYEAYLASYGYLSLGEISGNNKSFLYGYALLDIDQDGILEMIMMYEGDFSAISVKTYFWFPRFTVFRYNTELDRMEQIYTGDTFGGLQYSEQYKSIIPISESMFFFEQFLTIENGEMTELMRVGNEWDGNPDDMFSARSYFIDSAGNKSIITDEERAAYTENLDRVEIINLDGLISGKFVDAVTGLPLEGVSLTISRKTETGEELCSAAATGADGSFYLQIPHEAANSAELRFSRDGYAGGTAAISHNGYSYVEIGSFCLTPVSGTASGIRLSRVNYYDEDNTPVYFESYAYYDNGLLCSRTLHSITEYYTGNIYTLLYLYDDSGNLVDTVLDGLTIPEWFDKDTGKVTLDIDFSGGHSYSRELYPLHESIENTRYVDYARTERIYASAPVVPSASDNGWAAVYLRDVFNDSMVTDMTKCSLIYVDDNPTPELWVDHGYGYAGAMVYTTGSGAVDSVYISHGTANWLEKENLLMTSGGHMDVYSSAVYQIQDGKFVPVVIGNYGAPNNASVQYDENHRPIYEYYLNGEQVTEEAFQQYFSDIFDMDRAAGPYQNVYSYNQCKLLLQAIQG